MKYTEIFKEARRLYDLGFAIHWLHPKSKRPVESGWGSGPRKEWSELERTFKAGYNVGVRLGSPSKLASGYLGVVDLDIKSKEERHRTEALSAATGLVGGASCPIVASGRGGGSRHFYCVTAEPFKTFNPAQSEEMVKVHQPSKKPSKAELKQLTPDEIESGVRLSRAWEVSLYSDGRQVVLPPSVHPDSGKLYAWERVLKGAKDLPELRFNGAAKRTTVSKGSAATTTIWPESDFDFTPKEVEIAWLPISDEVRDAIVSGKGVTDRSAYLMRASNALVSAGLDQDEVLSVLTDPTTYLGACAYEHAQTKDRARAAAWAYRYTLKKVTGERSAQGIFGALPKAVKLTEEEIEIQTKEIQEECWRSGLVRADKGVIQKLIQNVVLIMKNAVDERVVQRDLFAYRDTYSCDTPWGGKKGEIVGNDDVARIKYWLGRNFRFEPSDNVVEGALVEVACQNAYDPVVDLLNELPEWDGKPRLDTWLKDYFGAEGDSDYLAQVFRKWMIAMILRVYEPGSKFDWMPIFEGAQGAGKSSFGRLLVGDRYFLDWLPNLHDKDSALGLQGMWGVEMGELSQFRKNELETIKAFITRTIDKIRPPYGKRMIESPRRCVFFGTTNRETYLVDETGNRRFKPVIVGALNFKALKRDRVQLFAEAKTAYQELRKAGGEIILEIEGSEARGYEKKIQSKKMVEDDSNAMQESMLDFVEKIKKGDVDFDLGTFKMVDLFLMAVGPLEKWKADQKNIQLAGRMLKRLGGYKKESGGRNFWHFDEFRKKEKKPTKGTANKNDNDIEELTFI